MKKINIIVGLLIVISLSGCATILTGTKQKIKIDSYPQAARVEVNGVQRGLTPCKIKIKKGFKAPTIDLILDGYETHSFKPEQGLQPAAILNLIDIFGWGIDAATGAMIKYSESDYMFDLVKNKKDLSKKE